MLFIKKLHKHLIFMCHFTPFIVENYKIFKSRTRVERAKHFQAHNNPLTLNKIFFAKISNTNFKCLLAPFTVEKYKKSLEYIKSFEDPL